MTQLIKDVKRIKKNLEGMCVAREGLEPSTVKFARFLFYPTELPGHSTERWFLARSQYKAQIDNCQYNKLYNHESMIGLNS